MFHQKFRTLTYTIGKPRTTAIPMPRRHSSLHSRNLTRSRVSWSGRAINEAYEKEKNELDAKSFKFNQDLIARGKLILGGSSWAGTGTTSALRRIQCDGSRSTCFCRPLVCCFFSTVSVSLQTLQAFVMDNFVGRNDSPRPLRCILQGLDQPLHSRLIHCLDVSEFDR